MMELREENVSGWMKEVTEMNSAGKSEECRRSYECLDELAAVLEKVHSFLMIKMRNPAEVLHSVPSLAKFLSVLCSNSLFLSNEVLFTKLMSCVLLFYKNLPHQRSVSAWTMNQLKQTVTLESSLSNDIHAIVREMVGVVPHESAKEIEASLIKSLQKELQNLPTKLWDKSIKGSVPYCVLPGSVLREMSELCLPLIQSPDATSLVESLLCCHAASDIIEKESFTGSSSGGVTYHQTPALSPLFLEALSQSQQNGYKKSKKGVVDLSYDARVMLWLQYLPSFEKEIMNLIESCIIGDEASCQNDSTLKELICSRQLPQACVSFPQLQSVANSLLSQFVIKSSGCDSLHVFLRCFAECLKQP